MAAARDSVPASERTDAGRGPGLPLYRLLRPVMRTWWGSVRTELARIPRPSDDPRGHSPGSAPLRVFLLGSGPALGLGVRSNALALPGQLARHLANHTRRGIEVVALAHEEMTANNASAILDDRPVDVYDTVVVALGAVESISLTPPDRWSRGVHHLISRLRSDAPDVPILFVGPHDPRSAPVFNTLLGGVAGHHARILNRVGERATARYPNLGWTVLPAQPSGLGQRHRTPEQYSAWARLIADRLVALLDEADADWRTRGRDGASPPAPQQSAGRPGAVERFRSLTEDPPPELRRVVGLAQRMFQTAGAAITLLDAERQWVRVTTGLPMEGDAIARADSICARTIEQDDVLVVPDSTRDERIPAGPLTREIRFYAGYPLESPDGHKLGALCVYDPDPREGRAVDPALLRDIGLQAQRIIWELAESERRGADRGDAGPRTPRGRRSDPGATLG